MSKVWNTSGQAFDPVGGAGALGMPSVADPTASVGRVVGAGASHFCRCLGPCLLLAKSAGRAMETIRWSGQLPSLLIEFKRREPAASGTWQFTEHNPETRKEVNDATLNRITRKKRSRQSAVALSSAAEAETHLTCRAQRRERQFNQIRKRLLGHIDTIDGILSRLPVLPGCTHRTGEL